ncbi:WSSV404 [White spot syndrome virus]|uniref:WSSV404 n=1 Tax=White spot syndrome virus TaxID=342409 RepID=A0A2I6SC94_9VIRU|nr:WSSV404 [White spot syndrome virus]
MTGLRMAKLPVLCMFGRTEYDNLEDFTSLQLRRSLLTKRKMMPE